MMEEKILMIETSTDCCSVALSAGDRILASRIDETPRIQSAMLAPYIAQTLSEAGLSARDLDAVAVSRGPGSYTGLRVGVSTAKGICFGAGIPLIGVDTLQVLALQASGRFDRIVPMIDARRMEVYAAVYAPSGEALSGTEAVILDADSFRAELDAGPVCFIGTGAAKFREVCSHPNACFQPCSPLAASMLQPAARALQKKEFEDVAYFEPFYLKQFIATTPKKLF